jgi:hypothetical protein
MTMAVSQDIKDKSEAQSKLDPVSSEWGKSPQDHFGYATDNERLAKRGLEDWELVDTIPESQRKIPVWFIAVVVVVLLIAIGLSFPFWGNRPGYERDWINWGFGAALLYIGVAGVFVYFMVNLYGSHIGGKLDSDKSVKDSDKRDVAPKKP